MPTPRPETVDKWQKIIEEQKSSGETLENFCKAQGINLSTLKFYRTFVNRRARQNNFSEVVVSRQDHWPNSVPNPIWVAAFIRELHR